MADCVLTWLWRSTSPFYFSVLSIVTIAGVPFLLIGYYRLKKRSAAAVAVKVSGGHKENRSHV